VNNGSFKDLVTEDQQGGTIEAQSGVKLLCGGLGDLSGDPEGDKV
jgi:hypothetical protein